MKNRFLISLLMMAFVLQGQAQSDSSYTLKQCIDYALANSASVQNAKFDEYIAKAKIGETRAMGLPQINGTVSVIDNPALKKMFFRGNNQFLLNTPSYTGNPNDVAPVPNIFQLRSSGDASATVSQLLFSGSYIVGLQSAKIYAELSQKATKQSKINTVEAVKKAFYMTLINKEQLKTLDANIARLDTTYRQQVELNKNGLVEKLDVSRIEVSYLNLLIDKQKAESAYELSLVLLKFQMNMPIDKNIKISGSIAELKSEINTLQANTAVNYNNLVEFDLLTTQRQVDIQKLKLVKSGYLPTLSAFATGGYTRSDVKFTNLFSKAWFPYTMVGLTLNVPIFDGFSKCYQTQQAKLEIKKIDNSLANMKNGIDYQTKQAITNYNNNLKNLEVVTKNLDLSKEIVRVTKIKYQEGVGSNIELINAEADLQSALSNYYSLVGQTLISLIDYQKATGTLSVE